MKKILIFLLCALSFVSGFSQTGNDTTKYSFFTNTYGNKFNRTWGKYVAEIPNDTIWSKSGISKIGNILYIGNGVWWTAANGAGGAFVNPMTTPGDIIRGGLAGAPTRFPGNTTTARQVYQSIYDGTNSVLSLEPIIVHEPSGELAGDQVIVKVPGVSTTNQHTTATYTDGVVGNGCPVVWTGSGLIFTVGLPCSFNIGGNPFSLTTPVNVTLPAADPSNPKFVSIVVNTSSTATYVDGVAQANPEIPDVNQTSQLYLTAVFVDAGATTPTQIGQEIIWDEAAGGEASITKVNFTSTDNYATAPPHGAISRRVTAMNNGGYTYFQKASGKWSKANKTLLIYFRNNSVLAAGRNLLISLWDGATQVGGNINPTTYGYNKNLTGTPQPISIPSSAWVGADSVTRIRITNQNTGGTVDFQIDYVQWQSGIVQPSNSNAVIRTFRRPGTDSVFNVIGTGLTVFAFKDSIGSGSVASKQFLGTIYSANTFASLTGFSNTGGTWGTSTGQITVTGGVNDYSKALAYDYYSMLENHRMRVVGVLTSLSTGFAIGVAGTANEIAWMNTSTGRLTLLIGSGITSQKVLSFSAGDSVELILERYQDMLTATARNLTTNSTEIVVSYRYYFPDGTSNLPASTGKFSVYSMQAGALAFKSIQITSKEMKNADLLIRGDSKTAGCFADAYYNTFASLLQQNMDVVRMGGSGDKTAEWVNTIPEIVALRPKYLLLTNPSNDLRNGVSTATTHANYQSIVDAAHGAGIKVIHAESFYESGQDNSAWNTYLYATFAADSIIAMYDVLQVSGALSSDNSHPTAHGDSLIYKRLVTFPVIKEISHKPLLGSRNFISDIDYSVTVRGSASDSLATLVFGRKTSDMPMFRMNTNGLVLERADGSVNLMDLKLREIWASTGGLGVTGAIQAYRGLGVYIGTDVSANGYIDFYTGATGVIANFRALNHIFNVGSALNLNVLNLASSQRIGTALVTNPTAFLHLSPGLTNANYAPLKFSSGGALNTVAEAGAMEADAAQDLFYTNSTAQRVRVGMWGYRTTATGLTLNNADNVMEVTATGQTITLPTAVGVAGKRYTVKLTASGSATVATTSSQTIDASTTYSLASQYKYVEVCSNGANWIIVANN